MNDQIVSYIRSGEKLEKDFKIGCEFEYFIVDKNYNPINYNHIQYIFKELLKNGFDYTKKEGYIYSVFNNDLVVTVEPGCQFEISVKHDNDLFLLETRYLKFMTLLDKILTKLNLTIIVSGYHPFSSVDEIELIPIKRYKYMFDFFEDKGKYAHNMMKATASTQVIFDYSDEKDFVKKMRVLNILGIILAEYFENIDVFEKNKYDGKLLRMHIWDNCDINRCGMCYDVFNSEFSYNTYADYVLKNPPIFLNDYYYGDKLIYDIDKELNEEVIEHMLNIVFPYVRVKKYIELRIFDTLPYPLNFGLISLLKGLIYNKGNLDYLSDLFKDFSIDDYYNLKNDLYKSNYISYLGVTTDVFINNLIKISDKVLSNESIFLNYIREENVYV